MSLLSSVSSEVKLYASTLNPADAFMPSHRRNRQPELVRPCADLLASYHPLSRSQCAYLAPLIDCSPHGPC